MILSLDQIKTITKGAISVIESGDFISFSRFTSKQIEVYKRNPDFYMKTKATAGVRFDFITDSQGLSFEYKVSRGSSRSFCFFDVYENEILRYHIGKDKIDDNIESVKVQLSKGKKRVTVYFPCLSVVCLKNVIVDDGSLLESVNNSEKFLFYGDSITQGYDSFFSSLVYAMRVSDHFKADCLNQGIGAEVFDHQTLDEDIPYHPTKVFVAYGTNDWSHDRETLYSDIETYLKKIKAIHNEKEIYLITPIYRLDDMFAKKTIGNFFEMTDKMIEIARDYNVNIIKGINISVPSNKAFSDNWLHPNEIGFEFMAKGIIKTIYEKERNKNAK